jgi:hypothetical protein
MQHIDLNNGFWIQHSSVPGSTYTESHTLWNNNMTVHFINDECNQGTTLAPSLPYSVWGWYKARLYRHFYLWTIPLPPFVTNPGSVDIIDNWITHKTGLSSDPYIKLDYDATINSYISGSNIIAGLETYTWEVFETSTYVIPPIIYPYDINSINPIISIQLWDPGMATTNLPNEHTLISDMQINAFPNPSDEAVTVSFTSQKYANCIAKIYNSLGQLIFQKSEISVNSGNNKIKLDTDRLPAGVYNIVLNINNANHSLKITVSHK